MNKKIASEIAIGIILLITIVVGGVVWLQNKNQAPVAALAVTQPVAQAPAVAPVAVQQSKAAAIDQKQAGEQETQPMAKANKDASAIPEDWKTYTNTKFNFEFKCPSDATVVERTGTGIFVLLKGQVIKQTGNYIFNLSPPFKNGNTLEVYKNAWLEGDSGTFTSETLAGNDAWKITGAHQNSKNESEKNLTYHYFLKNDYAYLFIIENGTIGEQILSTFKFTK